MSFELMNLNNTLLQKHAINEIIKCNEFTVNYSLVLTLAQAMELLETSTHALKENKRVEFGSGLIEKIIKEFCNSPYLSKENYAETLNELIEIFYYYKNESLDLISDDDLIKFMHKSFDGTCQGSVELLYGRDLEKVAHNLRYGHAYDYSEEFNSEEEEGDEYGTDL